jgi:hypothetical protein
LFAKLQAKHGTVLVVVDQPASIGALPLTVARDMGCPVAYLPGLTMRRIADFYPGEAKTDARDAFIIADAARAMPHTLRSVDLEDETITGLEMIVGFDDDLTGEATRVTNRLHGLLVQIHPRVYVARLAFSSSPGLTTAARALTMPMTTGAHAEGKGDLRVTASTINDGLHQAADEHREPPEAAEERRLAVVTVALVAYLDAEVAHAPAATRSTSRGRGWPCLSRFSLSQGTAEDLSQPFDLRIIVGGNSVLAILRGQLVCLSVPPTRVLIRCSRS